MMKVTNCEDYGCSMEFFQLRSYKPVGENFKILKSCSQIL